MSRFYQSAVSEASKLKPHSNSSNLSASPDINYLISSMKRSEERKSCMEYEIYRLTGLFKKTSEKEARWKKSFLEVNSEAIRLNEVAREANAASACLKEDLITRENELRKVILENEELRKRETALLVTIEALTNSLAEKNDNYSKGEDEIEECEKDYDVVPKLTTSIVPENKCEDENDEGCDSGFEMWMWEQVRR